MRFIFSFAFFLSSLFLTAQNNLRLYDPDGNIFSVYLGDSLCNKTPQTEVLLSGLKKDSLKLRIKFANENVEEFVYLLEKGKKVAGKEFVYTVSVKKSKPKFEFAGYESLIQMPAKMVPDKPVIDTSKKYDNKVLEHYVDLKNGRTIYFNNYPFDGKCQVAMPGSYLNYMALLMKKAQTDDDVYLIAENTTRNNCMTVDQLNVVLSYVPYEIEKLRLIHTAYFSLIDVQNRDKLSNTFKLDASKKELADFFKNSEQYKFKTGITCEKASSNEDIAQYKSKLQVYSSDVEKLMIFRKTYTEYCFNMDQVKEILNLFLHDRERLETAKLLYHHCVEKDKFIDANETFSYEVSKAEMINFLEKQK
jgi:hypothetical protein